MIAYVRDILRTYGIMIAYVYGIMIAYVRDHDCVRTES